MTIREEGLGKIDSFQMQENITVFCQPFALPITELLSRESRSGNALMVITHRLRNFQRELCAPQTALPCCQECFQVSSSVTLREHINLDLDLCKTVSARLKEDCDAKLHRNKQKETLLRDVTAWCLHDEGNGTSLPRRGR
jgi:hypothetical protein